MQTSGCSGQNWSWEELHRNRQISADYLRCGNRPYPARSMRVTAQILSQRRIRRYFVLPLKAAGKQCDLSHVRFTYYQESGWYAEKGFRIWRIRGAVRCGLPRGCLQRDLQKPWTAGELAEAGGLSESMFRRCFREIYGIPAAEYMRHHRLEQAAELLKTSEESILEIAAQVGYENPGKFAARFRRQYGCLPREYRLQQKKVGNEMEQFERNGLD